MFERQQFRKKYSGLGFLFEKGLSPEEKERIKITISFLFYNVVCFFVCSVFCLKRLSSLARHYLPSTIYYQQVREKRERARERRGEWSGLKF